MWKYLQSKRPNGQPVPVAEVLSLEQLLERARSKYHAAVEQLDSLQKQFESTDHSSSTVTEFQAREAEIRKAQLEVESTKSAFQELETSFYKNRDIQEKQFVAEQKQLRIKEIDAELLELSTIIPQKQILINTLPFEVEKLRQRSFELMRERATLL